MVNKYGKKAIPAIPTSDGNSHVSTTSRIVSMPLGVDFAQTHATVCRTRLQCQAKVTSRYRWTTGEVPLDKYDCRCHLHSPQAITNSTLVWLTCPSRTLRLAQSRLSFISRKAQCPNSSRCSQTLGTTYYWSQRILRLTCCSNLLCFLDPRRLTKFRSLSSELL
jgi:hypothetical protein